MLNVVFFCEILLVNAVWCRVKLYLSWVQRYIWGKLNIIICCCCLLPALLFSQVFFFRSNGMFIVRHLRHLFVTVSVKHTLAMVIRITYTFLIFRVFVIEVILKVLPLIQRSESWQKLNLFISDGGNFWRHFACLSFAWHPRKQWARVSHEMAQFVLKIAHLVI